ncbi:MAG: TetR/AcrR family transcriptional regulator [Deltaproteobacteria bacterium]|nr:TetR/AcrR family transcriptional regulator [Deltaproteobacteria bacterium]
MAHPTPLGEPLRVDRAERTRQRLLDAAAQCFANAGYSKTTVEEIAASAHASKAVVYHHFRGKESILEALLERTLADWARVSDLDAYLARGAGLLAAFERSLRASLDYARRSPLLRALFQLDPAVVLGLGGSAAVQRSMSEARTRLVAAVRAAIASGELRSDLDPECAADLLRLVMIALCDHLLFPQWIDASDERFVATCVDVLQRGLRAEGAR